MSQDLATLSFRNRPIPGLSLLIVAIAAIFVASRQAAAIPIDNGVEGEPEIQCGSESIEVTFRTRNAFNGRLYVKGRHGDNDCQNEQLGRLFTGITLSFGTCNVQRLRSLNPKGIFASTTVVISFHPLFVTKVDRVYKVQCFYMESEKTVSQSVQVSDLTTAFVTRLAPMPICRYEVLYGGPTGQPVQFAIVGQQEESYPENDRISVAEIQFGYRLVHSCTVADGRGETVAMLDDRGCAIDRYVLNNLEYPTDLSAGQEAHVFKYADRSQLLFACQIAITLKERGAECARPTCGEPLRGKRHTVIALNTITTATESYGIDVATAFDAVDRFEPEQYPYTVSRKSTVSRRYGCASPAVWLAGAAFLSLAATTAGAFVAVAAGHRKMSITVS